MYTKKEIEILSKLVSTPVEWIHNSKITSDHEVLLKFQKDGLPRKIWPSSSSL